MGEIAKSLRSILVASDLTDRSRRAVARGHRLALRHGARLTLLHVIDPELPCEYVEGAVIEAERALAAVAASLADCDPELGVRRASPDEGIVEEADRVDADLIIVGCQRRAEMLGLFRGSTSERVMRFGTRPVLVAKGDGVQEWSSVLVAVDLSEPSARALEMAARLVSPTQFHVAHIYDAPFRGLLLGGGARASAAESHARQFERALEQQVFQFLDNSTVSIGRHQVILREGEPDVALPALAAELSADLIVVGTQGRSGIGRLMLGSVAEAVVANAPIDVLAVPGW